ncbi:MAG TPA: sugar ABC transporter permease [Candidatus Alectryocaccomicrobium excrementavium]|uniref:Sugar ABC transporter permease n=1 Tax=Candidatus Alectryocaccomicrobium excrementavium TaxID=2840668 RepID=A0A9D1K7I5_9FIRM|nr:sugar ABC transporter permease [Candidatus Alectryocaccomicrobium excrementavium]
MDGFVNAATVRASARPRKKKMQLLFMALPLMALVILFNYVPLFGWIYSLFDYRPGISLWKCDFVGLEYFKLFLTDKYDMYRVMKNTIVFALIGYLVSPLPMLFAILLNEVKCAPYKKVVQTISTMPNFVSWVIVYSLMFTIFSTDGLLNEILMNMGLIERPTNVLADASAVYWFQTLLGQWKNLGWSSIVYLAAISGIDQEMYEAASIDGANRLQSTWHITIPSLMPTYIVLLLLSIGNFVSVGFDQYFVFKNNVTSVNIEVLDVYVYRIGLMNADYSYGVAIGIMKSVVSITLLFIANFISKKVRGNSIF